MRKLPLDEALEAIENGWTSSQQMVEYSASASGNDDIAKIIICIFYIVAIMFLSTKKCSKN